MREAESSSITVLAGPLAAARTEALVARPMHKKGAPPSSGFAEEERMNITTNQKTPVMLLAAALFLGGCYLQPRDQGYEYSFCDRTGCFDCIGSTCYEVEPQGDGDSCVSDFECMEGCYCAKGARGGVCIEAGFCRRDTECDDGYICQEERDSCAPAVNCNGNAQCGSGFCGDDGTCQPGGTCGPDGECSGDDICDDRNMCVPPSTATSCQGEVFCEDVIPICAEGSAPAILDGCYTGECVQNSECPDDNPCGTNTREECADDQALGRCFMIFAGVNCTSPSGEVCDTGDADCVCQSFRYAGCDTVRD